MAKMYGQLPSYIKANATIFDMQVTSAVLAWEKEQYDKANGNVVEHNLSQEEMLAMIKAARKEK